MAFMVFAGHVNRRTHQALRTQLLDVSLVELQVLKAPAELVTRNRAVAKLGLRLPHGFNGQDTVQDAEVVIGASNAGLVGEIAFSGAVNGLDDVLQNRRRPFRIPAS